MIILDGVKYKLTDPDVDKDGKVGGVEKVERAINDGTSPIYQEPEAVGIMKEFDADNLNPENMSTIDFNAYLKEIELAPLTSFESLQSAGMIPSRWTVLPRKAKRNSRSLLGFGSNQKKETIVGQREKKKKKGKVSVGKTIGNLLTKNKS